MTGIANPNIITLQQSLQALKLRNHIIVTGMHMSLGKEELAKAALHAEPTTEQMESGHRPAAIDAAATASRSCLLPATLAATLTATPARLVLPPVVA